LFSVSLTGPLDSYLQFVAELAAGELNSFLTGLGVNETVSGAMLYSVESAAGKSSVSVKPKKKLIVAVGIVAGAMLGVFAALLRTAIRKRRAQTEAA